MIWLCFAATAINYVDRAALAVGAPYIQAELDIDPAMMGLMLSGFFWTYAIMQLPFGWLVDRIGVRTTYAVGVAWWSVFTAATALVTGPKSLFAARLALGAGEAACYPSNAKVVGLWFPARERGFATGIFDSGARAGSALSLPIVAGLIALAGWRASFIVIGAVGILWVIVWLKLYRDPSQGTASTLGVTAEEQGPDEKPITWLSLFRYRTVWGMMLGFFCLNSVAYFFITWFPSYLVQARGFSLAALGTLGMAPALAAIPANWIGGWATDAMHRRGYSLTVARKSCLVAGMLCSSTICLAGWVNSVEWTIVLFSISYAGVAFAASSVWSLPGDVAPTPHHIGSIGGIQNFAANTAGIVVATATGVLLSMSGGSYLVPLAAAGALAVLGAFSYLFIVGPIEPLPARVEPLMQAGGELPVELKGGAAE